MGSLQLSHSSPSGCATMTAGEGMKHKMAKLIHGDPIAELPVPMQAPMMYCAPSVCDNEPYISAESCKAQLGERTFNILRQAMLQQQESFIEQLWELHRLTRTQHRRAALLPTECGAAPQQVELAVDVFSRTEQERIRSQTMQEISQLPTVPNSLKRTFVAVTSTQKGTCVADACPGTSDVIQLSPGVIDACAPVQTDLERRQSMQATQNPMPSAPSAGPFFSGFNGDISYPCQNMPGPGAAGFAFADGTTGNPFNWASRTPHIPSSAFSTTLAMHGQPAVCGNPGTQYLSGLQQQGGLGLAAVQQLPQSKPEAEPRGPASAAELLKSAPKDASLASAQQTQVDVSSLLGIMAPGLQPMPDIHQQWVQRNVNRSAVSMGAQAISPTGLSLQKVMDVPVPEVQEGKEPTMSPSNNTSVWSTSSLFMPAALQVPALMQQQLASDAMHDCKFSGLPSAAAMMLPEPLAPSDSPSCSMPHLARNNVAEKDAKKKGPGTCHTDESAASILMSLKGS